MGPLPLSDMRKKSILTSIHAQLEHEDVELPTSKLTSLFQLKVLGPTIALAASLLLFFVFKTNDVPHVPQQQIANLTTTTPATPTYEKVMLGSSSVKAIQKTGTRLSLQNKKETRQVNLKRGQLVAEFNRKEKEPTLTIQTPHLRAVVRGTIFAVTTFEDKTEVAVQRGKVEVFFPIF